MLHSYLDINHKQNPESDLLFMTSDVFDYLKSWIHETLGEVDISPETPVNTTDTRSVSLYLKGFEESSATGTTFRKDRLQIQLSYLVTTSSKEPHEANNDLTRLAFAAMMNRKIEPDFSPLATEEWNAFGVQPKPSFSFKIPLNFEVEKTDVKRVKKPLIIKGSTI